MLFGDHGLSSAIAVMYVAAYLATVLRRAEFAIKQRASAMFA